jgi:GxxExxY protein
VKVNEITGTIIDVSIDIHRLLGPGLLESVYHAILIHELKKRRLDVQSEVTIPVRWDGMQLDLGFRADLIVEGQVIVELKSVERTAPVHRKQVLTYLKVSGLQVGLLLNFGEALMKDGVYRLVNKFAE